MAAPPGLRFAVGCDPAIGGEVDESEATPEPNQSDKETSEKVDEVELDAELAELKRKLSAT